jgi:hypothetical protein
MNDKEIHMLNEDQFLGDSWSSSTATAWTRYCGFLDLSVDEFCEIQRRLLMRQIEEVSQASLYKKVVGGMRPLSMDEFRQTIPLTSYKDYAPYLQDGQESELPKKPRYWIHTSASRGTYKRVPWTDRFHRLQCRNIISTLILSSAEGPGDVQVMPNCKLLNLIPERPFASAQLAFGLRDQFSVQLIPAPETSERMPFIKKMDTAILMALNNDTNFAIGMTSSLMKLGERLRHMLPDIRRSPSALLKLHPAVAWRLLWSRRDGSQLPRGAWKVKGIIGWGADSDFFEKDFEHQWGKKLLQMYASSESGIMAMQDWRHGPLAFLPDSVFFEFIPREFVDTNNPPTVLIGDVEEGKVYEPVITSFYGMPFLRYRQGDLVRLVRVDGKENSVPRMTFVGRADDTIDMFGIARLNTDVVSQALEQSGLTQREWFLRKEFSPGRIMLRLYIEMDGGSDLTKVESRVSRELKTVDRHWAEAVYTMGYNPIKIKALPPDTFCRLASDHGRVHMNPPDSTIQEIDRLTEGES